MPDPQNLGKKGGGGGELAKEHGNPREKWIIKRMHTQGKESEDSRRLWLPPGSVRGFSGKTPGKSRENCWKIFPESGNATNSRISGTGKGKPAGNLGSTLPGPCPHLPCGVFLKSTVPAFSSFLKEGKCMGTKPDPQRWRHELSTSNAQENAIQAQIDAIPKSLGHKTIRGCMVNNKPEELQLHTFPEGQDLGNHTFTNCIKQCLVAHMKRCNCNCEYSEKAACADLCPDGMLSTEGISQSAHRLQTCSLLCICLGLKCGAEFRGARGCDEAEFGEEKRFSLKAGKGVGE